MTKKNKLAGILSVVLLIVFIVSIITAIVTGIVTVFMFFAVPIGAVVSGFSGSVDGDHSMADFVEIFMAFVTAIMFVAVSARLMEVLKTISAGTPFEGENADRFKRIAKIIVIAELVKIALVPAAYVWSAIFGVDYGEGGSFSVDLTNWLGAAIALVLAEVFREGARLREEQEYTV